MSGTLASRDVDGHRKESRTGLRNLPVVTLNQAHSGLKVGKDEIGADSHLSRPLSTCLPAAYLAGSTLRIQARYDRP